MNLIIISKEEFISLYKYGKLPYPSEKVINPVTLTALQLDDVLYEAFKKNPFFEYEEEYLIIKFSDSINSSKQWIEIEDLTEVIPLTAAAKNSLERKFDSRIKFQPPKFQHVYARYESYIDFQECLKGALSFWKLARVEGAFLKIVPDEIIFKAFNYRIVATKSYEINDSFLTHLFVYDRYESFPNNDLGFFYDVGEIYAHTKGLNSFKGSKFHFYLEKNRRSIEHSTFINIIESIISAEETAPLRNSLIENDLELYVVGAIFLKFKNDLRERESIKGSDTGQTIQIIKKHNKFINELKHAVYLTGAFFGFKKFYDDYYELVGLNIFKDQFKKKADHLPPPATFKTKSKAKKQLSTPLPSIPSDRLEKEIKQLDNDSPITKEWNKVENNIKDIQNTDSNYLKEEISPAIEYQGDSPRTKSGDRPTKNLCNIGKTGNSAYKKGNFSDQVNSSAVLSDPESAIKASPTSTVLDEADEVDNNIEFSSVESDSQKGLVLDDEVGTVQAPAEESSYTGGEITPDLKDFNENFSKDLLSPESGDNLTTAEDISSLPNRTVEILLDKRDERSSDKSSPEDIMSAPALNTQISTMPSDEVIPKTSDVPKEETHDESNTNDILPLYENINKENSPLPLSAGAPIDTLNTDVNLTPVQSIATSNSENEASLTDIPVEEISSVVPNKIIKAKNKFAAKVDQKASKNPKPRNQSGKSSMDGDLFS